MNTKTAILFLSSALCALSSEAAPCDSILAKEARHESMAGNFLDLPFSNPAVKQFRHDYSYSRVSVGYDYRHEDQALRLQKGDGDYALVFEADTYMKYRTSTLWGKAFYNNGKTRNVKWNETSDLDIIYPYVLADEIGGDMNVERYSFAGGYASFNGKIGWGGEISYLAGLHYRGVDPRPRNITGDLSLSAGIGLAGPLGYFIALSGMFRKYKQTNEVTFFSELGNEKLYHLTGLGADYKRFAGTGYDTYYNGYAYGIVMSLFPSSAQGFSASVALSRFTFENIISDFNKLPMAEAGHNRLEAEIGYTQPRWGLKGTLLLSRRVGKENIFGDPASQVYPLIGSLPLFYENRADLAVAGFWEKSFSRQRITILPEIGYHHWNMIYADPSARQYVNDLSTALKAKCTTPLGRTFLSVSASGRWIKPIASRLDIGNFSDTSDVSTEIYTSDFRFLSKDNWYAGIEASLTIPVTAKYALQGSVSWTHGFHALDVSSDKLGTSLSFIF